MSICNVNETPFSQIVISKTCYKYRTRYKYENTKLVWINRIRYKYQIC